MDKRNRDFEKSSLLIFAIMMAANVCNYLFQMFMGRALSLEEFAILNALLSLSTIVGMFANLFTTVTTRYISRFNAHGENNKVALLLKKMLRYCVIFALAAFIISIPFVGLIGDILKISSSGLILAMLGVVALSLLISPLTGGLQGLKRFLPFSLMNFLPAFVKLAASLVLVYVGAQLFGIIFAVGLGYIVAGVCGGYWLRRVWRGRNAISSEVRVDSRDILKYVTGAFLIQFSLAAITNGDMLLVKTFFTEAEAGAYASAMVIGKISMYVSNALVAALLPMVTEQTALRQDTRPLLKKSFLYGGGTSVLCAVGILLFAQPIISIMFGEKYLVAIPLLLPVCVFVIPLTFLTILMNYALARSEKRFMALSYTSTCILCFVAAIVFHGSIAQMLYIISGILCITFILNLADIIRRGRIYNS